MRTKALLTVALLCCSATSGFSQRGYHHCESGDRGLREEMKEKLNLSVEQEQKIDRLRTDHRKKMVQLRAKVEEARIDMGSLRRQNDPDRQAIAAAIRRISDLRLEMQLSQSEHRFAIRDILTPEQREVFREHRGNRGCDDDHRGGMNRRHGRRGRGDC